MGKRGPHWLYRKNQHEICMCDTWLERQFCIEYRLQYLNRCSDMILGALNGQKGPLAIDNSHGGLMCSRTDDEQSDGKIDYLHN